MSSNLKLLTILSNTSRTKQILQTPKSRRVFKDSRQIITIQIQILVLLGSIIFGLVEIARHIWAAN